MPFDPAVVARGAAVVAAVLFAALVLFQLALALGAPWGRAAYGGRSAELSVALRATSAVAAIVWTTVALAVLRRAGLPVWAPLPQSWLPAAIWVVVALSAIAIVMNAITPSGLERAIWLPVAIVLFGSVLTVAIAAPR